MPRYPFDKLSLFLQLNLTIPNMKKSLLLLFALVFLANLLYAQSQRKVLIEHFTQASCAPCAAINPVITPIIQRNLDKVTKITHQVSWPGVDPMNKDNPGDVQNRVNYYGVTGVPDVFLDAYSSGSPTATITDASILNAYFIPSPYEITIVNTVLPDYNSIEIAVTVKLTGTVTGSPMLRVAALEKIINWTTPPGNNGEKVFHHVLKKYIPNTNGTNISEINQIGQSKTYTFIYKFDKLYDFKNLETAAFIQNDATREVYQSENKVVVFTPSPGDDAAIKSSNANGVFGDTIVCGNSTTPILKVINTGNKSITSMDIIYSVNGGPNSNYRWTGKLDFLKETDITLPGISFVALKGSNQLKLEIVNVNDVADFNNVNNVSNLTFYSAPSTTTTSKFEMKPGAQPSLLTFVIYDDQNKIILNDGPFTSNATKTYDLNLEQDKCYRVYATNNTASLNGTFKVYDNLNVQIFQQRVIGVGTVKRDFSTYSFVTGTNDEEINSELNIYPNPASQNITINYTAEQSEINSIQLVNLDGKTVLSKELKLNSGLNKINLNIQFLPEGIYFVNLKTNKGLKSTKLIVR